ncbi:MAG: hypothetical protein AAFN78_13510, partial [Pseudomonadota bacterium]
DVAADFAALFGKAVHKRRVAQRVDDTRHAPALVYGFAEQRSEIGSDIIKDVVRDRKLGGLFAGREEEPMPAPGKESG